MEKRKIFILTLIAVFLSQPKASWIAFYGTFLFLNYKPYKILPLGLLKVELIFMLTAVFIIIAVFVSAKLYRNNIKANISDTEKMHTVHLLISLALAVFLSIPTAGSIKLGYWDLNAFGATGLINNALLDSFIFKFFVIWGITSVSINNVFYAKLAQYVKKRVFRKKAHFDTLFAATVFLAVLFICLFGFLKKASHFEWTFLLLSSVLGYAVAQIIKGYINLHRLYNIGFEEERG